MMSIRQKFGRAWRAFRGSGTTLPAPATTRHVVTMDGLKSFRPQDAVHVLTKRDPGWRDWTNDVRADRVFADSSWVFTCVTAIATAVSSAPWYVERRTGDPDQPWMPDEDNELAELIRRPNSHWSWSDLIEHGMMSLLLSGNVIHPKIRLSGGGPSPRGRVGELWMLEPRGTAVVESPERFIAGYEHTSHWAGTRHYMDADDVVHIKLPNPFNLRWGLSPLVPAGKSIDADLSAAEAQKASTDNMFAPAAIITFDTDKPLGQSEANQIKESFDDQYVGARNAGKTVFLGSKARYTPIAFTSKEMDYILSRKLMREEVIGVYRTPPPIVGILDRATYNNSNAMQEQWWVNTLIPHLDRYERGLNRQLVEPDFGDEYRLRCDTSQVPALRSMFDDKLKQAERLQKLGYSANEINRRLRLGMKAPANGDLELVPTNLQNVAALVGSTGDE